MKRLAACGVMIAVLGISVPVWAHTNPQAVTLSFKIAAVNPEENDGEGCPNELYFWIWTRVAGTGSNNGWRLYRSENLNVECGDNNGTLDPGRLSYIDVHMAEAVPLGAQVDIAVEAWDADSFGDDQYDLDPSGGNWLLNVTYNTATHAWSGDTSNPWYGPGDGEGDAWRKAKIWFWVQSDPDSEHTGNDDTSDLPRGSDNVFMVDTDSNITGLAEGWSWRHSSWSIYTAARLEPNGGMKRGSFSSPGPGAAPDSGGCNGFSVSDLAIVPPTHLRTNTGTNGYLAGCYKDDGSVTRTGYDTMGCDMTRNDPRVDWDWSTGSPGDGFTATDTFRVRWDGEILTSAAGGTYCFGLASDDGGRIRVKNGGSWTTVCDDQSDSGYGNNDPGCYGNISLDANRWYPIEVGYYENGSGAKVAFMWHASTAISGTRYRTLNAYKLWAKEADTSVGVTISSLSTDLDLFLYDEFGNFLAESTAGGTTSETVSANPSTTPELTDGFYTVVVGNWGDGDDWFDVTSINAESGWSDSRQGRTYMTESSDKAFLINTADAGGAGAPAGGVIYYCASVGSENGAETCNTARPDQGDYYAFWVENGEQINVSIQQPGGADFDIYLYPPGVGPGAGWVADSASQGGSWDTVSYTANSTGLWTAEVWQESGYGVYNIEHSITPRTFWNSPVSINADACDYTVAPGVDGGTDCWLRASTTASLATRFYDADSTPAHVWFYFRNWAGPVDWPACGVADGHIVRRELDLETDSSPACDSSASYLAVAAPSYSTTAGALARCYRNKTNGTEREFQGTCDVFSGESANIDFNWGAGSPDAAINADYYNAEWFGEVLSTDAGTYRFCMDSDDGGFIHVNKQVVMDDRSYHGMDSTKKRCGLIRLAAATWYPIRAGMFEGGGGAGAKLYWTPPGGTEAIIPGATNFRRWGVKSNYARMDWVLTAGTNNIDYDVITAVRDGVCTGNYQTCGTTDTNSNWNVRIDVTAPTVTYNSPAASSWVTQDFAINVSDADARGALTPSGLASCEYMVESYISGAWSTTRAWTARTCNSSTSATVTVAETTGDCRVAGTSMCRVTARATDNVGNVQTLSAVTYNVGTRYSGTLYESNRSTITTTTETIGLARGGTEKGTATASSGAGAFTIPSITAAGDVMTLYIKLGGSGAKANLVTLRNATDLSSLALYKSHLVVRNDNGGSTTTTNLTTGLPPAAGDRVYAVVADPDSDAVNENLVKVGDASSSVHLYVAGGTFAPNPAEDTASGTTEACKSSIFGDEAMVMYGDVITAAGATLNLSTFCAVVRGSWNTVAGTLSCSCVSSDGADRDANADRCSIDMNPGSAKTIQSDGLNPFCRLSITDSNDPGTVSVEATSGIGVNFYLNVYDGLFLVNNAGVTATLDQIDFLSESSTDPGVVQIGSSGGVITVSTNVGSYNAYSTVDIDGGTFSLNDDAVIDWPANVTLDVSAGSATLQDSVRLYGAFTVSGGSLTVNGWADLYGTVTLSGTGTLAENVASGDNWWSQGATEATINMSGGTFDVNFSGGPGQELRIYPGITENITGGTIQISGNAVQLVFCSGEASCTVDTNDVGDIVGKNCPAGNTLAFSPSGTSSIKFDASNQNVELWDCTDDESYPTLPPTSWNNLEAAAGTGTILQKHAMMLTGNLTVSSGTFDTEAFLNVDGNVSVATGALMDGAGQSHAIRIGGNFTTTGTGSFNDGSTTIRFDKSSGAQTITLSGADPDSSGTDFDTLAIGDSGAPLLAPTVTAASAVRALIVDCSEGSYSTGAYATSATSTGASMVTVQQGCTLEAPAGGTLKFAGGTAAVNSGGTLKLTGTSGSRSTLTSTDEATPVRYALNVSGSVNINYAIIKYSRGAGLSLGSTSTITNLSNVAFASADNTDAAGDACATTASCGHLTINVPNLNARFKGTTFDNSFAARPNGYNVRFCDTTSPYTDGFLLLEREAVPPGGYNNSGTGEAYDADDPSSNAHEAYDDCANDGAMAQWVHYLNTDISTTVSGFPVSAADTGGTYIGTYVGTGGTLYLLDSKADIIQTVSLGGGSGNIVGAPYWWYSGTNDYVYVTTDAGRVYKYENAATGDPTGSPLTAVAGWPAVLSTAGGTCKVSPVAATTGPVVDDKLVYFGGTSDAGASKTACIFGVENEDTYDSDSTPREQIVTLGACSGASANIAGAPAVKGAWNPKWLHIGSNCSSGELFRVKLDPPTAPVAVNCSRDVVAEVQSWMTGSFGKLFFGTMGGASARFYAVQNTENDTACSATAPDAYSDVTGFPYAPADSVSSGAKVNWPSTLDEAYFADVSGALYCVCQNTGTGCGSVGAACSGFPVTLEAGQALREPLIDNGTIYVASNSGKIFALESLYDPSCSDTQCDGTAAGALVGGLEGYPFNLGANLASTLALRTVSGTKYIAVGSDSGRIYYLPVVP